MKRRLLLAAGTTMLATPTMSQPRVLDADALRELALRIDAAIAARRLPGAVLWVERLGVEPHVQVFGQRAWEPMPEPLAADAVYDVASLTKPLIGMLVSLLVERGVLNLDEPVHRLLREFTASDAITWRHLLTHSSGLPAILPLAPAWRGAGTAHALACSAKPTHAPGSFFRYSDINYILLGTLIERLTGAPLQEVAKREVLAPLGMRDSGYLPLERNAPARLVPTEYEGETMLRGVVHDPAARRMGGVAGHAGLFATAADMARLARCVLQGGAPVLTRGSVELMTRSASPPGQAARGLGWDIASPYSRPRGAVYPMGSFGHTGFTGCAMWLDPHSASFYVFLSNRVHPRGSESIVALYEEVGTWAARAVGARDAGTAGPQPQ